MAHPAEELPGDPTVVVTNPEEDCSPKAFASFVADLLADPLPGPDSLGAAEALHEVRSDATG